jgi:AcrR family transcriptional regulator
MAEPGTNERVKPEHGPSSVERLAQTRVRLLDAVIQALAERGYAETSTTEVARRSGLTRGAQLHHFGTKNQMMLAAVEHLNARASAADIATALDHIPADRDRLTRVLELLSDLFVGQLPAAYIELWVASRAHPELREALRDADVIARDSVRLLFGAEILEHAGAEFDSLLDLTLYALRGMALDAHLVTEDERNARRDLILDMTRYLQQALDAPEGD